MKHVFYLIFLSLFITGCNAAEPQSNDTPKEKIEDQSTKKESNETEKAKSNKATATKKENESGKKNQKKHEKKYVVDSKDYSIQPIKGTEADSKIVLLTIDDAPDQNALEMAKIFKKKNAPAVFFVNGHFLSSDESKKVLKNIHEMGFAIGNHTMTHKNLKQLSEKKQKEEIIELNERIKSIIGEKPAFFRAPFGANTKYSKKLAADEKMIVMNWTYGYDWESDYQTADALAHVMTNSPYLKDGANLLMHDLNLS
ncbi:polysaccharide deacetylase family protein [Bacillus gobiensis]|uniref:polysaccharide deacetylase family protein n=1 Tax=Bacillus gobiensis TaxID=1441095 RepID=UPI003D212A93